MIIFNFYHSVNFITLNIQYSINLIIYKRKYLSSCGDFNRMHFRNIDTQQKNYLQGYAI